MCEKNAIARYKRSEIFGVVNDYIPAEISRIICMYAISAGELLMEFAWLKDPRALDVNISPYSWLLLRICYFYGSGSTSLRIAGIDSHLEGKICNVSRLIDRIDRMNDILGYLHKDVVRGGLPDDIYHTIATIATKMRDKCACIE
jgi:hypothetical protein